MRFLASCAAAGVAALLVSGCGQLQGGNGIPGATARTFAARNSGGGQLMYVAEHDAYGRSSVRTYTFPKGKPKERIQIAGVNGDCADNRGDVFVMSLGSPSTISEYAPGNDRAIRVYFDWGYTPTGCAVDPTTGNIAVANFYSNDYTTGTIGIFTPQSDASGAKLYADPDIFNPRYCGYDANGNLYVDGYSKTLAILFAELPAHSSQFNAVTLNQVIDEPGNLQWDGRYLAIGDSSTNVIYQFSMNGSSGTEAGATTLQGVAYGLTQFWVTGSTVVGAAAVDHAVGIWKYPEGGAAIKTIKQKQIPIGVAVSAPR